jgi:hypothetical protein
MSVEFLEASVAPHFRIDGDFARAEPFGSGHINRTYLAHYRDGNGGARYVYQRINDAVFTDVPAMMQNIARVTRHVRGKLANGTADDAHRRVLTLVPPLVSTDSGHDALRAEDGSWWRAYRFIDGARTYDTLDDPQHAYRTAKTFGCFIEMLADLGGERLHETIPAFHDTPRRHADLVAAVERDPLGRAREARAEIAFCDRNAPLAGALEALRSDGAARECVTHNDTKVNNVMMDVATGEGLCVIDLDTVMPGLALYDFGDMVRTATMPVAEDERDLARVEVDAAMYAAVARGFVEGAGSLLGPREREHLVTAGRVITFECGMRFLADHLLGDTYFRIHRPGQNLDRARTQFALVDSLTRREAELHTVSS